MSAIPTLRLLTRPLAELKRQARSLARHLLRVLGPGVQVQVVESSGRVGGGALPQVSLPSRALALRLPPLTPCNWKPACAAPGPPSSPA